MKIWMQALLGKNAVRNDRAFFTHLDALFDSDRFKLHTAASGPDDADMILLFVYVRETGAWQQHLLKHPLFIHKPHREKLFVISECDRVMPAFPGVYCSAPARCHGAGHIRTGHYLTPLWRPDPGALPPASDPRWMASFAGRFSTHAVRSRLRDVLGGPDFHVLNTEQVRRSPDAVTNANMGYTDGAVASFRETMADSRLSLCPRGLGTSSWRLFESLQLGRPPIIISDAWVPPTGPDWDTFSVRVAEADIATIPEIIRLRWDEAPEMGRLARRAWEEWFSPEVTLQRLVQWCQEIAASNPWRLTLRRVAAPLAVHADPDFWDELRIRLAWGVGQWKKRFSAPRK